MKELIPYLKNIKAGPKTTILGALFIIFATYSIYNNITSELLSTGMIAVGLVMFFLADKKKDDNENNNNSST